MMNTSKQLSKTYYILINMLNKLKCLLNSTANVELLTVDVYYYHTLQMA